MYVFVKLSLIVINLVVIDLLLFDAFYMLLVLGFRKSLRRPQLKGPCYFFTPRMRIASDDFGLAPDPKNINYTYGRVPLRGGGGDAPWLLGQQTEDF